MKIAKRLEMTEEQLNAHRKETRDNMFKRLKFPSSDTKKVYEWSELFSGKMKDHYKENFNIEPKATYYHKTHEKLYIQKLSKEKVN